MVTLIIDQSTHEIDDEALQLLHGCLEVGFEDYPQDEYTMGAATQIGQVLASLRRALEDRR